MKVYIYGPPGCGKTRNAERLKTKFNCARIVDEWPNKTELQDRDLVLGHRPEDAPPNSIRVDFKTMKL